LASVFVIFEPHAKPTLLLLTGSPDPQRQLTEDSDMTRPDISLLAQFLRALQPTLGLPALLDRMEGRV
jgi:hypothetical protein